MIKKCISIGLLVFISVSTFVQAQEASLTKGPKIKNASTILLQKKVEDNILVVAASGSGVNTRLVSSDNLVDNGAPTAILGNVSVKGKKSKGLETKKYKYENVIELGDKTIAFFVQGGKKKDKGTKICAVEIDNEGQMKDKPVELASNNQKKKGMFSSYNTGVRVISSEDHKKFAIISQDADVKVKGSKDMHPGVVSIKVYDETFSLVGDKTADLEVFSFGTTAMLSNDGFVSCLAMVSPKTNKDAKKLKKSGEATVHMSIVGIDVAGASDDVMRIPINLKGKAIVGCGAIYDKGELVCSGTYTELTKKGKSNSDIDGFFYARIDTKTGEPITQSYKKLDKEMIEKLGGQKASKNKKGKGISDSYAIQDLLKLENGTTNVLLEAISVTAITTRTVYGVYITHYLHMSGDIIVINLNKEGNINWTSVIKKMSTSVDDGGIGVSFAATAQKDKLLLVFNDNPNAYTKTGNYIESKANTAITKGLYSAKKNVAILTVDENGNQDRRQIAKSSKQAYNFRWASFSADKKNIFTYGRMTRSFYGTIYLDAYLPMVSFIQSNRVNKSLHLAKVSFE